MRIKILFMATCLSLSLMNAAIADDMGAMTPKEMQQEHGGQIFHMLRLETDAGTSKSGATRSWDVKGWIGNDEDKLYLKTEGEYMDHQLETGEVWALYSRKIATFWDAQAGMRYDFKPHSTTYATFGVNGLAPYYFETEAHLFISDKGHVSARLREENDFLLTQKLIVQPYAELNLYLQDAAENDAGAGVGEGRIGLQTRYEFTRKFAPYIDIHYGQKFGETGSIAKNIGEDKEELVGAIGLRLMF